MGVTCKHKKTETFCVKKKSNKLPFSSSLSAVRVCAYIVVMAHRGKKEVKEETLKIRCARSFKERLEAAAKRESRSMSNLIVMIMTKYCEQQEAVLSETPPLYLHPKTSKSRKRSANTQYPQGEEKIV